MDKLYEKAFEYKKTKLWKQVSDSQIIAVKHSDGTTGYCCIMGMMGEHIALAVYPGEEGLETLRNLYYCSPVDPIAVTREKMLSQNCISCSFQNMSELRESEKKLLRAYCSEHNIRLRGKNSCPQFEKMEPYRVPWFLRDEKDKLYMEEALSACIALSKRLKNRSVSMYKLPEGVFDGLRVVSAAVMPDGSFQWGYVSLPDSREEEYETDVNFSEVLAARVRRSKKRVSEWKCDVFLCPSPVYGNENDADIPDEMIEAPFLPLLSIIINGEGKVVSCIAGRADEDYAKLFTEKALEDMLETGKPGKITVINKRAYNMYLKLAKYLGIKLVLEDYSEELEEAEDALYGSMEYDLGALSDLSEDIDFELSADEKELMTNLIESIDDFSELGDMELFSMLFAAEKMQLEISGNKSAKLKEEAERRSKRN